MPPLNKRVIYVDQFALSEMVKVRGSSPYRGPHEQFYLDLRDSVYRLLLTQQAIFPDCNMHQDESLVSGFFGPLRDLYEDINGDVSLLSDYEVQLHQLECFVESWLADQGVPSIKFDVDEVLEGERNSWLSAFNIQANMDYSAFVKELVETRGRVEASLIGHFHRWKREKKPFRVVLDEELRSYGNGLLIELADNAERKYRFFSGEVEYTPDLVGTHLEILIRRLFQVMRRHTVPKETQWAEIVRFFKWDGLRELPCHRISAYMFAALARRAAGNQKNPPNRGIMNDVRVISAYAPYVDAMFVDNECAALLSEGPLTAELNYKAKIFSLRTRDQFLSYLKDLQAAADPSVVKQATDVYAFGSSGSS